MKMRQQISILQCENWDPLGCYYYYSLVVLTQVFVMLELFELTPSTPKEMKLLRWPESDVKEQKVFSRQGAENH